MGSHKSVFDMMASALQAAKLCTMAEWSRIRQDLILEVGRCQDGYIKKHKDASANPKDVHTLEASALEDF